MGIVVITLQDERDGNVSLGFTTDPLVEGPEQELTDAQILGMMAVSTIMQALRGEAEEDTSRLEG